MASEKSTFSQFQSIITILTPIIVAAGGFYGYMLEQKVTDAEAEIANLQTTIRNVEAMETYFKMMGGDNDAEAKMAAYALYMLNKNDPEMAVSMIMAPGKEHLMSVLIDLGSREPAIFKEVQKILETQDDTRDGTEMQQTAQRILSDIHAPVQIISEGAASMDAESAEPVAAVVEDEGGWSYLGNFKTGEGARINLDPGTEPVAGRSYTLNRDVNMRSDYPNSDNGYKQGYIVGVARTTDEVTIVEIDIDRKDRVWAKLSVSSN